MANQIPIPQTLFEFQEQFANEEACESFLFQWRWPSGFRCPKCAHDDYVRLAYRRQFQCRSCKYQVSITAGTVMHKTRLALRKWFWAMYLVARHKKSISAVELQRDLGLGSYRTAWKLLQKIRLCFGEKSAFPLKGAIEIDESIVGAKGKGAKPGRDLRKKSIVIVAIELGPKMKRYHKWGDVRARVIDDFKRHTLGKFVTDHVLPPSLLRIDGAPSYSHLESKGYVLSRDISSSYTRQEMREANPLPHVHLFFSNFKTWIRGRFHGVSQKHLPAYLNEFVYRLNRRHSPPEIFGWLARRLMNNSPAAVPNSP